MQSVRDPSPNSAPRSPQPQRFQLVSFPYLLSSLPQSPTISSHRTGVYVPTASLGTSMSKAHILWVASPYFFYSFPFQTKLVTSADKTPASFIGTPLRNLFLSPWTMLLSAQLLARPLVFFTLLLRLRSFLFLYPLLLMSPVLFLFLLQFKRTLRTSLRLIPVFRLLSSTTPLLQPRLSFRAIHLTLRTSGMSPRAPKSLKLQPLRRDPAERHRKRH